MVTCVPYAEHPEFLCHSCWVLHPSLSFVISVGTCDNCQLPSDSEIQQIGNVLWGNFAFLHDSRAHPLWKAELKQQWPNPNSKFHLLKQQKVTLVKASASKKARYPSLLGGTSLYYFEGFKVEWTSEKCSNCQQFIFICSSYFVTGRIHKQGSAGLAINARVVCTILHVATSAWKSCP